MGKTTLDANAIKAIEEIIQKGNDAKVKKKGGGVVISEEKQTIKYSTQ